LLAVAVGLTVAVTLTPGLRAGAKKVPLVQTWKGSVEDLALQKLAPGTSYVATAKEFAALWNAWKIGEKAPQIDFTKQLVLVVTTRGSRLGLTPQLDGKGDLRVLGFGTRDLRPGFRYVVGVVDRAGIKTINGKELPAQ
jgi:hypothetical protein